MIQLYIAYNIYIRPFRRGLPQVGCASLCCAVGLLVHSFNAPMVASVKPERGSFLL